MNISLVNIFPEDLLKTGKDESKKYVNNFVIESPIYLRGCYIYT